MIRVIAICVFRDGKRILVSEGVDSVKGSRYARPLGGGVELGETAAAAVTREIQEELGQGVTALKLLGVLENIFKCEGRAGHEIVFVYDGRFVDESMYRLTELPIAETGWEGPARWRALGWFGDECRLVPEGLAGLLRESGGNR